MADETGTIEAVKDELKRRVKNPFIGSFIIALVFLNWNIFLYLIFSKSLIEEKIQFVPNYYRDLMYWIWYLVVGPFLIAFMISLVGPAINTLIKIILEKISNKDISLEWSKKQVEINERINLKELSNKLEVLQKGYNIDEIELSLKNAKDELAKRNNDIFLLMENSELKINNHLKFIKEQAEILSNTMEDNYSENKIKEYHDKGFIDANYVLVNRVSNDMESYFKNSYDQEVSSGNKHLDEMIKKYHNTIRDLNEMAGIPSENK
jgi:hypothetical protein